jgi:hypothetical protein
MMSLEQPVATIIAASIAAALSAISAILTFRSAKAQHKVSKESLRAEESVAARSRLRSLLEKMNRTDTSIRRLSELIPSLPESRVVEEAMSTFAVLATFFDLSAEHEIASYEETIRVPVNEARLAIGRFILALDLNERRPATIAKEASAVAEAIAAARHTIERYTIVSLS